MKKSRKTLVLIGLAGAVLVLAVACTGKKAAAPAAQSASVVHEVTLNATNWKFEPAEIDAKLGDSLKLTLKNVAGVHGVKLDEFNVNLTDGQTVTVALDKKGSFQYYCSIDCGHGHDGMIGTLVVK